MIVAIPIWQGRISPVLDVAERVLLFDPDALETNQSVLELRDTDAVTRAAELHEAGVDLLICGALSRELESALNAAVIRVHSLCCGDVEDVVHALQRGESMLSNFSMPGCRRRQRRGRCGRNSRRSG